MYHFAAYATCFFCLFHIGQTDMCPGVKDLETVRDGCIAQYPDFKQDVFCQLIKDVSNLTIPEDEFEKNVQIYVPFIKCLCEKLELFNEEGKIGKEQLIELAAHTTIDLGIIPKIILLLEPCVKMCPQDPEEMKAVAGRVLTCCASAFDKACNHKLFGNQCFVGN